MTCLRRFWKSFSLINAWDWLWLISEITITNVVGFTCSFFPFSNESRNNVTTSENTVVHLLSLVQFLQQLTSSLSLTNPAKPKEFRSRCIGIAVTRPTSRPNTTPNGRGQAECDSTHGIGCQGRAPYIEKWQYGGLNNRNQYFQYPLKHAKEHQDHSNWANEIFFCDQNRVYMHNGGHLKQWAPSWIFKWLHNREKWCQLPSNIQRDTRSFQSANWTHCRDENPNFTRRTAVILKIGRYIWILNGYITVRHDSGSL